jgi:2-polyprenyl-6-methoxyphenol hydroxylase-like FAD-dependent oxidoreductase
VDFQTVIIGGGIAGATAALALARAGHSVLVIESSRRTPRKIGETLGPESRPLLQSLEVWEEFVGSTHLPSPGRVSAWGGDELAETDFIFNPYGGAWQLDRAAFEEMLLRNASHAGSQILRGCPVRQIRRCSDRWGVETANGPISSQWLIDASGRRAVVASALGIKRESADQLVALHCTMASKNALDEDARTLVEACNDGWWYTSLIGVGRRVVSFQTDVDVLKRLEWRAQNWMVKKMSATHHLSALLSLHGYEACGAPALTSAQSGRLSRWSGRGWLAIGDAAMSFDPLSGAGMLKAMQSALEAARAILCEEDASVMDFERWNQQQWDRFLADRSRYYGAEKRWPGGEFWERRQKTVLL